MLIGWARLHLIGFPLQRYFEKEFQTRIASEFDLNTAISSERERKSTGNKEQSFGGKAKGFFRPKTYWFTAWKQFVWGLLVLNEALDRSSWPPNWKLIIRFARSRLISITDLVTLSAWKNSVNSVGTLRVRSGKESSGFKKLLELVWTLAYVFQRSMK